MEWKNVKADFSDANELMKTSSEQIQKGSKQAVDSITSVADMLRQEKIDKLNELALKHTQYIEDQTLTLDQSKQKDYHSKTVADIHHLATTEANDTAETNAHIALYKKQGEAVRMNADANVKRVNLEQERLKWQKKQLEQQRKDAIAAKEEKKQNEYNNSLKSPGSVYFTFDKNGNRVNHSEYVWGLDGKPTLKSVYYTNLNKSNSEKQTKTKNELVKIVSSDLDVDSSKLDAAVNTNKSKWFNKGYGKQSYINSKTYNDIASTLSVKMKGDINKVKTALSNTLVYDPKTGGMAVPKQFVDNNGNFKSSLARKAFYMKTYYKMGASYSEAARLAGVRKNEVNKLNRFDILGQNNGE